MLYNGANGMGNSSFRPFLSTTVSHTCNCKPRNRNTELKKSIRFAGSLSLVTDTFRAGMLNIMEGAEFDHPSDATESKRLTVSWQRLAYYNL